MIVPLQVICIILSGLINIRKQTDKQTIHSDKIKKENYNQIKKTINKLYKVGYKKVKLGKNEHPKKEKKGKRKGSKIV